MGSVYLLYSKYYDIEQGKPTVGGIQTYITTLSELCRDLGHDVYVVQRGNADKEICFKHIRIIQFRASNNVDFEKGIRERLLPKVNLYGDLFIYATDTIIFKKIIFPNSIAIQHGIYWDVSRDKHQNPIHVLLAKSVRAYRNIKQLKQVKQVICVDHNFVNWMRTQIDYPVNNFKVIPNYAEIAPICPKPQGVINIIFARRLYTYRGTRIFTESIIRLLQEGVNINVTIAGTGQDEQWMKQRLGQFKNVTFITYESQESLKIHADKHIAVIPTLGSEGTSLSLLEAMSAQCAVICTNVGGMTNIVIDGYNGVMISPDVEELYVAIKLLVENSKLREEYAAKAYETVLNGFPIDKWKAQWKNVIENYFEKI